MHKYLIDLLKCPTCHGRLDWEISQQTEARILQAEATCTACDAVYPVRDGIGVFLTPDLPRKDLWEETDSALSKHLNQYPNIEHQLMDVPYESLSATDQQFRAMILDERGEFAEAKKVEEFAKTNLYTPVYLNCWEKQIEFIIDSVNEIDGPIVDLASGRGYLVESIVKRLKKQVIATDFSLKTLQRNQKTLKFFELFDQVSLLAFDARRTPFKDGAVPILTTNLGLPNIENPGKLLQELRRIVRGTFLAVSHFFPEDDLANNQAIIEIGLEKLLYKESAIKQFSAAGWTITVENPCFSKAGPTPASNLFTGARADRLPVANTELEWCVLRAE